MFDYRLFFHSSHDQSRAIDCLDENGCDYDWDSGDRMMVDQDGLDCLYDCGVDFAEV